MIREELNLYRHMRQDIAGALRLLDDLEDRATSSGSSGELRVMASLPLAARFEDIIADKTDLEHVIGEALELLKQYKRQVAALIALAPDPAQRILLTMRYINCMRWEEIAAQINYSERYTYKLHRKALAAIERAQEDSVGQ